MGVLEKLFGFSAKEKRDHYNKVAKGEKPVKENSKFSKAEQIAYARGQRDARNESLRMYAYKNATQEERDEYAYKQQIKRETYKKLKKEHSSKNEK